MHVYKQEEDPPPPPAPPQDQFIFPSRYVVSQPGAASSAYDRRLIVQLPHDTPPGYTDGN